MFFSQVFNVSRDDLKKYGAIDISLVCDTPFFIDPMLIFNSSKSEYQALHEEIIKYFHFLYTKAQTGLTRQEIGAWFNFSEVPNNWLGYSMSGNKGLALGHKYAIFLHDNIEFAMSTHGITRGVHVEKIMLLYEGSGKDKISDLIVNLIKDYLCRYTEKFAHKYIDPKYCKKIPVDKAAFNYETESFYSNEYYLPCIINEKGEEEFVLLTPRDMLRSEEPAVNAEDLVRTHETVRRSISNEALRAYVNNYIAKAVKEYEEEQKRKKKTPNANTIRKIEKNAFKELIKEIPELYDYYIKSIEENVEKVQRDSEEEVEKLFRKLFYPAEQLLSMIYANGWRTDNSISAREEAKSRIKFFKHTIENCDGYKNLYVDGEPIANEEDLQRLFKFVWYGTSYKVDAEPNNGRGRADFIISMGKANQNVVEFKLASNSKLPHVFDQVAVYESANEAKDSLIVIFYFTEQEYQKTYTMIKKAGKEPNIDESIFLIDCRSDNKISASNV